MEYEPIYNSIRQQQYRLGIVKRTPVKQAKSSPILSILYTILAVPVLYILVLLYTVKASLANTKSIRRLFYPCYKGYYFYISIIAILIAFCDVKNFCNSWLIYQYFA